MPTAAGAMIRHSALPLAVVGAAIDFLEEPTGNPADFERLYANTGLPYALDETLRETIDLTPFPHAAGIVIKPTLMGSFDRLSGGGRTCGSSCVFGRV